jgi:hypothetical protein
VTIDGVWTGNWIYLALTDRNYSAIANSHSAIHYSKHLSLPCLHHSLSGNGFQLRTIPFLWVPELSPCLSYQLVTATTVPSSSGWKNKPGISLQANLCFILERSSSETSIDFQRRQKLLLLYYYPTSYALRRWTKHIVTFFCNKRRQLN